MVGIRSITYQLPEKFDNILLGRIEKASRIWDGQDIFVRTQRVCLTPFTEPVTAAILKDIAKLCDRTSTRWFDVPLRPHDSRNPAALIKSGFNILADNGRAFVNVLGVENKTVDAGILGQCANLIRKVSTISPDGKDNFRLGISFNAGPDCPFFPFTWSSGKEGFSIALELTGDFNEVCGSNQGQDLASLRQDILDRVFPQIQAIYERATKISADTQLAFKGFDFSLAPIIGPDGSIISLLNSLGVYDFGKTGSMFATAFLTNILKHLASRFPSVGFSGVMYSLLEDLELCTINNRRGVSLNQLITLSTMCGCGLDMVPVYGQMKNEEYMSIFLDVAGISCRLGKPLGVRILPIQQCQRGQSIYTAFRDDPDFIANTKVVTPDMNLLMSPGNNFKFLEI